MTQETCGYKCIQEERIRQLESNQAETRVYVKEIKEDIKDMRADLKTLSTGKPPGEYDSKAWSPIVMELIKALTTAITVIGAIVGALKFAGK